MGYINVLPTEPKRYTRKDPSSTATHTTGPSPMQVCLRLHAPSGPPHAYVNLNLHNYPIPDQFGRKTFPPNLTCRKLLRSSPFSPLLPYHPYPPMFTTSVLYVHYSSRLRLRACLSPHIFHISGIQVSLLYQSCSTRLVGCLFQYDIGCMRPLLSYSTSPLYRSPSLSPLSLPISAFSKSTSIRLP